MTVTALDEVACWIVFKARGKKWRLIGRNSLFREVSVDAVAEAARHMRIEPLMGNPASFISLNEYRLILIDTDGDDMVQLIEFIGDDATKLVSRATRSPFVS